MQHATGALSCSELRGPMVSNGAPLALDLGPQLTQEGAAGDAILVGAPDISKELG